MIQFYDHQFGVGAAARVLQSIPAPAAPGGVQTPEFEVPIR